MSSVLIIDTPSDFSFRHTVSGHGWSDLLPFKLDEGGKTLSYVFRDGKTGKPYDAAISSRDGRLTIKTNEAEICSDTLTRDVRHILRLDEGFDSFYKAIASESKLAWVAKAKAGRLLRSPTVFEDLVKTLCTTNCSWALTKKMTANLVEKLGEAGSVGRQAFPTPGAMASVSADFFREEIRAGYRSPYFAELAENVAGGKLDPESWLVADLPTAELKKQIKSVKGVGDYAAENLLKLLGRYDGLALDSWLRSQFYKKYNDEKVCGDGKIESRYKKFGSWQGLAIWCDLTEKWFDDKL